MSGPSCAGFTAIAVALVTGCGSDPAAVEYDPQLDAASFVAAVTNPFFPLVPGTTLHFAGQTDEGLETNTVAVLGQPRVVAGITATVVHDRVYLNGSLIEETWDWYAQDRNGDVWYLGEDSREMRNGTIVSRAGSWETGVDGAKPGIIMWADPAAHVGASYRQEYYRGQAEDWARVLGVGESVTVPFGTFTGCIRTEDWNALDRDVLEHKYYCPQLGETMVVMVRGGTERIELVNVTK